MHHHFLVGGDGGGGGRGGGLVYRRYWQSNINLDMIKFLSFLNFSAEFDKFKEITMIELSHSIA